MKIGSIVPSLDVSDFWFLNLFNVLNIGNVFVVEEGFV